MGIGLVALTALGSSPTAQQTPQQQQQPPIFRGGTNIVRVDVTVTDRRGEPATELTRDDFSLTEDGAPQTIESCELVRVTGEPTDDRSLEIYSASQVAMEAARDDVRLFLIFWDEYHIGQFIPATRGREILTEFVHTAFGPTDLVGIMDQLTTVESIKFTRERLHLVDQVHALKGRLGVYVPPRSAVEQAHLQDFRSIGRLRNEVTASALNAAAAFLGNFREGRKAILFVSQGFPLYGRNDESNRFMEIVRTANTNNTAIYTLDPASEVGRRPDSLLSLAEETGGRPFVGSNRPELQLPQIVRDSSAYYLLGYRSPAPVDGKFHRIRVRMNKDGYEVRARSGYFAPTVGEMERGRAEATAAEIPADVERALGELSLNDRSDHLIDYWIGTTRGDQGRTRLSIAWMPKGSAATGKDLGLAIQGASSDGTSYFASGRTTSRQLAFDVPPGELVLKLKVIDGRDEELENANRKITVPAFDDATLAVGSPMILRTRTAREARAITEGAEGQPEARREFDRTDRLFVRFPVYGGEGIATAARLLNRRGKELGVLTVAPLKDGIYQVDLPLSTSLRDDYVIAIEATRGTDSAKAFVPFRVR
ncbi:MAG TPA: VWA domain-containing protein [Vicinamibacterales bacterium]|nr:VWA domain-containing protein [Vicinamibacterales bacterium]